MINKALCKYTNWAFVLLLVLAIPFCWFVELLELMVISEGFETSFFSTVWGASIYILHTALWVFVCGVLFRRVRRRERCTVAIPLMVFAAVIFRILLLGYGVYRKGLRWVWVLVPLGSHPLGFTEAAEFIVYLITRLVMLGTMLLSVALALPKRIEQSGHALPNKRLLLATAIILVPMILIVTVGNIGYQNAFKDPPVLMIELRSLVDDTRTSYLCDAYGHMKKISGFEGQEVSVFSGKNVYQKDYFNWDVVSRLDQPVFFDENLNEVSSGLVPLELLLTVEKDSGYVIGVRAIQLEELWLLEVELEDRLHRPFRLYGYDGNSVIRIAEYESKELIEVKRIEHYGY